MRFGGALPVDLWPWDHVSATTSPPVPQTSLERKGSSKTPTHTTLWGSHDRHTTTFCGVVATYVAPSPPRTTRGPRPNAALRTTGHLQVLLQLQRRQASEFPSGPHGVTVQGTPAPTDLGGEEGRKEEGAAELYPYIPIYSSRARNQTRDLFEFRIRSQPNLQIKRQKGRYGGGSIPGCHTFGRQAGHYPTPIQLRG